MTIRPSLFYPFAVKDWLLIRRERSVLRTVATVFVSIVFIALTREGVRQATALQFMYILPGIVAGSFFTRWIESEVQALLVLRLALRNTLEFFFAKFSVMVAFTSALAVAIAAVIEAVFLRDSGGLLAVRLALVVFGCVAQCALCLGVGCCFTDLEESASQRRMTAPALVQAMYWLSVLPVTGLLWILEKLLTPGNAAGVPVVALQFGAVVLSVLLIGSVTVLLAIGARRLSLFE